MKNPTTSAAFFVLASCFSDLADATNLMPDLADWLISCLAEVMLQKNNWFGEVELILI